MNDEPHIHPDAETDAEVAMTLALLAVAAIAILAIVAYL